MTRKLVLVALVALAALVLGGCGKTACERTCDYFEECEGLDIGDCEDECYDDYKDEDSGCQRAIRDFAQCLDATESTMGTAIARLATSKTSAEA
jgi:hypothetical protein